LRINSVFTTLEKEEEREKEKEKKEKMLDDSFSEFSEDVREKFHSKCGKGWQGAVLCVLLVLFCLVDPDHPLECSHQPPLTRTRAMTPAINDNEPNVATQQDISLIQRHS